MSRHRLSSLLVAGAFAGVVVLSLVASAAAAPPECEPEPASQWAPAGYVCPPRYGDGVASAWGGPGAAVNWCRTGAPCDPIRVTSHLTGLTIIVTPTVWCHCYVEAPGPNGEGPRLVDLDPAQRHALGLDYVGLYDVTVVPANAAGLPDTSMEAP